MNLPLSSNLVANVDSVEEAEQVFKAELVDSSIQKVESASDFGVQMNRVAIGQTSVSCIGHRSGYTIDCGDIDSLDSVIFSIGHSATSYLNGRSIDLSRDAAIITRRSNLQHRRDTGSMEFALQATIATVEKRLQASLDRAISKELYFADSVSLDKGIGAHGASTLRYIVNSFDSNPALLDNALISANFEDLILGVILALPNNYTDELLRPERNLAAPAKVRLAEEYMEANAHLSITLTDVISHVGCGRKAFYANFRRFREYTPHEYLASRRLKLAHERLSNPTSADTVTSIAYDSGFSHIGRFSESYRKRYGVNPSVTLRLHI
jgi:AraC-like DNA-binding protein